MQTGARMQIDPLIPIYSGAQTVKDSTAKPPLSPRGLFAKMNFWGGGLLEERAYLQK